MRYSDEFPPHDEAFLNPSLRLQADRGFQASVLVGVSRTFAFTIPQLPPPLRTTVTNAYLLCRIADTVEDYGAGERGLKCELFRRLVTAVESGADAGSLARELGGCLKQEAPVAERELINKLDRVLNVTRALPDRHRHAITRCVRTLCEGMERFETLRSATGLRDREQLEDYCYHVAGVVGEMLTSLFCDYSPELAGRREELMKYAVAFGRGLQMTNILKDVSADRGRGVCWLPRDVFRRHGCELRGDVQWVDEPGFREGIAELVGYTRAELRQGLHYTLLIPASEVGIRRFCAWAIGLALLTLRRVNRDYCSGGNMQAKITRAEVRRVVAVSNLAVRHDWLLKVVFRLAANGLPASSEITGQGA